jgi:WD40 repeat protein
MDGIARLWSVPRLDASFVLGQGEKAPQATALMELHHHASPVSSLTPSADGQYVLTAGWDSTIAVFPVHHAPSSHDSTVPVPRQLSNRQTKRRKVDPSLADEPEDADVSKGGWRVAPEAVLRGHQARVGKAAWDKSDQGRVWSCGWDGSVRGWDVELQVNSVVKVRPTPTRRALLPVLTASSIPPPPFSKRRRTRSACRWTSSRRCRPRRRFF